MRETMLEAIVAAGLFVISVALLVGLVASLAATAQASG
jgi:hypothetical protein